MSYTHSVGTTYKTAALTLTNTTDTYTSDGEVNESFAVAASTTNYEVDIVIDVSQIKSMVLYSDQAVTIKTNSTGTATDTIVLAAKKQVVWTVDHLESKPLTGDVTKMYITNSNSTAANVVLSCLVDYTPA
jgi:hypothetical protein